MELKKNTDDIGELVDEAVKIADSILSDGVDKTSTDETTGTDLVDAKKSDDTTDDTSNEASSETSNDTSDETSALDKKVEDIQNLEKIVDNKAFDDNKGKKKALKTVIITLASIIVGGYLIMALLSLFMFQPGTVVNGQPVQFMNEKQADAKLENARVKKEFDLTLRTGGFKFSEEDINYDVSSEKYLKELIKKQNPFFWFEGLIWPEKAEKKVDSDAVYSETMLVNLLETDACFQEENMEAPENPYIVFFKGEVVALPGYEGSMVKVDEAIKLIIDEINNGKEKIDITNADCYEVAEYSVDSNRVKNCVERCNKFISSEVTYLYGDTQIVISAEDIFNMLTIDDEYNCKLPKSEVNKYLLKMSEKYDTYGKPRQFRTHSGRMIEIEKSVYGWQMDIDKETNELYVLLTSGEPSEREPAFINKGYVYKNGSDIGGDYVEVDLSNQKVYAYQQGKLVFESSCVSGNVSKGNRTPGGIYSITYKSMHAILKGRDYETPVDYWMPFNRGIGFHDANWRGAFGGEIYMTNGSHGCVNLPPSSARQLYSIVEKGMPVICYWN